MKCISHSVGNMQKQLNIDVGLHFHKPVGTVTGQLFFLLVFNLLDSMEIAHTVHLCVLPSFMSPAMSLQSLLPTLSLSHTHTHTHTHTHILSLFLSHLVSLVHAPTSSLPACLYRKETKHVRVRFKRQFGKLLEDLQSLYSHHQCSWR